MLNIKVLATRGDICTRMESSRDVVKSGKGSSGACVRNLVTLAADSASSRGADKRITTSMHSPGSSNNNTYSTCLTRIGCRRGWPSRWFWSSMRDRSRKRGRQRRLQNEYKHKHAHVHTSLLLSSSLWEQVSSVCSHPIVVVERLQCE